MTVRNLEYAFKPRSVALIGASTSPGSVGALILRNLTGAGFSGSILPVNPKHESIEGLTAYPSIASLPLVPDLAVVCTPPDTVAGIIAELASRGTRAAVVITTGFSEGAGVRRQALLDAARPALLRLIGPNCLGIVVPGIGLNASFAHLTPGRGSIAFVAQSGAIATAIADWAASRGIGFSHLVSLGDMADVDFGDMLDYLANDPETRAILLYVEMVTQPRKFMSAARAAARMKPCLVVKAGRHPEGARAAASHTGALAGRDAVYDAVFRRAGMLRVTGLEELFDAVETLAMGERPKGPRLAILTNGGGLGVLATDALIDEGGQLAELAPDTLARLDRVLPPAWSHGNPVDIIGDARGDRYRAALEALLKDPNTDALLIQNCPTAVASSTEAAEAVIETLAPGCDKAVLTSWVGDGAAAEARRMFEARRIPTYSTPGQAVRGFMYLCRYRQNQELLMETPASVPEAFTPDLARARLLIEGALAEDRSLLSEPEAKDLLSAYAVPVVRTRIARSPQEAAAIAAELGVPVALKILSPDISHKTEVGGVVLDLVGPGAVRDAAEAMLARIREARPGARLDGLSVQQMVRRPGAVELIVGMSEDPAFGPVILFGQGGIAVEVLRDQALGLPPLNMQLAHELIRSTRIARLLSGFRGQPGADLDAIALTLIKIAQIAIDLPEVRELDINPLLADGYGVVGLDARVRIERSERKGAERLAIRPYPTELEAEVAFENGRSLFVRPIRPEDEPRLKAGFARLTPEEMRLRFFVPQKTLSHMQMARFTQLDYDREMALVLTERGIAGTTEIYGVVNLMADPDLERAEFGIMVQHDLTGRGLGSLLMRHIIDYAKKRGIREIFGEVLIENGRMLALCGKFGFDRSSIRGEPGIVRVTLRL